MDFIVEQKMASDSVNVELVSKQKNEASGKWIQKRVHIGVLSSTKKELMLGKGRQEPDVTLRFLLASKGNSYIGQRAPHSGQRPTPVSPYFTKKLSFPVGIFEIGKTRIFQQLCDATGLTATFAADSCFGRRDRLMPLYLAIWQACTGEAQYLARNWVGLRELPVELKSVDFISGALTRFMDHVLMIHMNAVQC